MDAAIEARDLGRPDVDETEQAATLRTHDRSEFAFPSLQRSVCIGCQLTVPSRPRKVASRTKLCRGAKARATKSKSSRDWVTNFCLSLKCQSNRNLFLAHIDRTQRVCFFCNSGALGNERHFFSKCAALAFLRSRYADLFTGSTDTTRSFFAQPDHMGVFHYVIDCLDFVKV